MIVLFTFLSATAIYATTPQNFLEVASNDGIINGVVAEFGNIAIAADHKIFLYKDNGAPVSTSVSHFGTIELPSKINERQLLEFKLTARDTVLYCDRKVCRLCALSSTCTTIFEGSGLQYAAASTDGIKLYLRVVDDKNNAALQIYSLDRNVNSLIPTQQMDEPEYVSETGVTESFIRGGYTYFVGSSITPNEPLVWSKLDSNAAPFGSVRIIRVCNRDSTKTIESKMELVLTCGDSEKKGNFRAVASHYGQNGGQADTLLVVSMSKDQSDQNTYVCRYRMTDIEERFDQMWTLCQNVAFGARNICRNLDDDTPIPNHCYIFTWHDGSSVPCSKFSGGPNDENVQRYDNCELSSYTSSAYRFGFLSDYKPVVGERLSVLPNDIVKKIVQVVPDIRSNSVFMANDHGRIMRVPLNHDSKRPTWSIDGTIPSRYRIWTSDTSQLFYYATKRSIKSQLISCSDLFDNCNSLLNHNGFEDALSCGWCAAPDGLGGGHVASQLDKFSCPRRMIVGNCPPRIVTIHREPKNKMWQFYGSFLDSMDNPKVLVCGEKCDVIPGSVQGNSMSCHMDVDVEISEACDIIMEGTVNKTQLKVHYPKTNMMDAASQTDPNSGSKGKMSRGVKAVIAVVTILLIIILLILITYAIRNYRSRNKESLMPNPSGVTRRHRIRTTPLARELDQFIPPKPTTLMVENIYLPSLYEQLSRTIDPELKIELDDITLLTEIGKGHFGIVYRGEYVNPETKEKHFVACKTLRTDVQGVRDFMEEGLLMAKFDHPRVMRLIGISFDDDFRPIIVTEYMPNGDLVKYLRDPLKTPTLRQLLAFAIQIAEGMDYIHSQNFIHRDLAARNCMLDKQLNIRIADFGLCREVKNYESYEVLHKDRDLPLRWMPLEALESQQFTSKGDVWAYGVVLWELMTRGMMPYSNIAGYVLLQYLQDGNRLAQPTYCPVALYDDVMLSCWKKEPEFRPKFTQLIDMVKDVVSSLEQTRKTQLNSHYERVSSLRSDNTPVASLETRSDNFDPPPSTIL